MGHFPLDHDSCSITHGQSHDLFRGISSFINMVTYMTSDNGVLADDSEDSSPGFCYMLCYVLKVLSICCPLEKVKRWP